MLFLAIKIVVTFYSNIENSLHLSSLNTADSWEGCATLFHLWWWRSTNRNADFQALHFHITNSFNKKIEGPCRETPASFKNKVLDFFPGALLQCQWIVRKVLFVLPHYLQKLHINKCKSKTTKYTSPKELIDNFRSVVLKNSQAS